MRASSSSWRAVAVALWAACGCAHAVAGGAQHGPAPMADLGKLDLRVSEQTIADPAVLEPRVQALRSALLVALQRAGAGSAGPRVTLRLGVSFVAATAVSDPVLAVHLGAEGEGTLIDEVDVHRRGEGFPETPALVDALADELVAKLRASPGLRAFADGNVGAEPAPLK